MTPTAPVAAIRLMLLTGMRHGEVPDLRRTDVDYDRGEIVLRRHKTARRICEKRIPVTPEVAEVLEAARAWRTSAFVFLGRKPGAHLHANPRHQAAEAISSRVQTALDRRDVGPIVTELPKRPK